MFQNSNSQRYRKTKYIEMLPALDEVSLQARIIPVLQQDDCPLHSAIQILNWHFHNKWIGLFSSIGWPPRSPDVTLCGFFMEILKKWSLFPQ